MCNLEEGWAAAESSLHGVMAHKQTSEHSHHSMMVPRDGQPHCCCCRRGTAQCREMLHVQLGAGVMMVGSAELPSPPLGIFLLCAWRCVCSCV